MDASDRSPCLERWRPSPSRIGDKSLAKMKLTEAQVKNLKPRDVDYRVTDSTVPNFSIRVYRSGVKTYFFRYVSPEGRSKDKRIGNVNNISLKEARKRALAYHSDLEHSIGIGLPACEANKQKSFGEVVELYCLSNKFWKLAPNTQRIYLKMLELHILPHFSAHEMRAIGRSDVQCFLEDLIQGDRGHGVSLSCKAIMSAIYKWALHRDFVESNIIRDVEITAEKRARERVLGDDEMRHFWMYMTYGSCADEIGLLAKFTLLTAQRISEVSNLTINEIDFGNRIWSIPSSRTKNSKTHAVPLSNLAVSLLRSAIGQKTSGRVWEVRDRRLTEVLGKVESDARFNGKFTAHDLRRTFATKIHLVANDADDNVVGKILNHSKKSNDAMASYNHYKYLSEKRHLLEAWSDHIASLVADCESLTEKAPISVKEVENAKA